MDKLQISGAIMAPSDGPSPVELVDAGHAPHGLGVVRDQYVRKVRKTPTIRMVPGSMRVEGRLLQFAVSDNVDAHGPDGPGSPPIWAVNIHGYFAGGGMYWRESARLAEQLGWRVINPSLPGFGGSDPLDWQDVSMESLANQVMAVMTRSMPGPPSCSATPWAGPSPCSSPTTIPGRTLGVMYRDGVSTPAWKVRHGIIPALLSPVAPEHGAHGRSAAAVVCDLPDLFMGRMFSTVRSVLPDMRRNIRTVGQTLPIGSLLMAIDQRTEVRASSRSRCRSSTSGDASTGSRPAGGGGVRRGRRAPVQWVPGGHSWMLARPQGQSDILTHLAAGKEFMAHVEDRWRQLHGSRDHSAARRQLDGPPSPGSPWPAPRRP